MPVRTSVSDSDMDHAIKVYLKGELRLSHAARLVHVSTERFKAELAMRGLRARTQQEGQISRHALGHGVENFQAAGKVAREIWINSDVNRARMAELGRAHGPTNVKATRTETAREQRSLAHQRALLKVSPLALDFERMLIERGATTTLEKAAGRYNIDIAVGPIAVEVHRYSFNPLGPTRIRERKRTHELCKRGWLVCYVWARPADEFRLDGSAADYVISLAKLAKTSPSACGEYRVIRSTGELFSTGRGDGDELS